MITIDKNHHDAGWLNREIRNHLAGYEFTEAQENAIKKLILEISSGYQHTISRQDWGIGWD